MTDDTNKNNDETKLSEEQAFEDIKGVSQSEVTPRNLLTFAKYILLAVSLMYSFSAVSELFFPGNSVFETCKITLPSVATLVIGYYFGRSK